MNSWLDERGVVLRGGGLDEAPQAYRRLPQVLAAQRGTVEVLQRTEPYEKGGVMVRSLTLRGTR